MVLFEGDSKVQQKLADFGLDVSKLRSIILLELVLSRVSDFFRDAFGKDSWQQAIVDHFLDPGINLEEFKVLNSVELRVSLEVVQLLEESWDQGV